MTVMRRDWSHPASHGEAKARLIGRVRYLEERRQLAGERREVVFELLLQYGFDSWGSCSRIARELGCHRSTITRDRRAILRGLL